MCSSARLSVLRGAQTRRSCAEGYPCISHNSRSGSAYHRLRSPVLCTVARRHNEFDRNFRPTSPGVRSRWERIATARRRGQTMPPIDVYRIGELHFVQDGHHRVSVARALGDTHIEAHVREVRTAVGAESKLRLRDLPLKHHERVFHERVPLPPELRARIELSDEWRFAQLGTLVEAW